MSKVTEWYPASVKPVRGGWYECQYSGEGGSYIRYFDGQEWRYSSRGNLCAFALSGFPRDQWRGLAEKPE